MEKIHPGFFRWIFQPCAPHHCAIAHCPIRQFFILVQSAHSLAAERVIARGFVVSLFAPQRRTKLQ